MARPFVLDPLFLSTKAIPGVGPRMMGLLKTVAGEKVLDLLWHLPAGLLDRRYAPKIADAIPGQIATIAITVDEHVPARRPGLPHRVRCHDDTGVIDLIFFNPRADWLAAQLPVGDDRVVSGKLEFYNGILQMPHPDMIAPLHERAMVEVVEPIYPLTAGLTQKPLQKFIRAALAQAPELDEWHDPALMKQQKWENWRTALQAVHHPENEDDLSPHNIMRQRLAYDELLANQLTIALVRQQQHGAKGRVLAGDDSVFERAKSALPFTLTSSQERAVNEIRADMRKDHRMLRLLQGDVGSGKTAVAFLSMAHAISAGGQAVLMAPTEILARQHESTISRFAKAAGFTVIALTGRDKGKTREKILETIATGSADIIIGTHALFQDDVTFHDLALVVIDEQHRFGVHQRMQLSAKGKMCDVLVMTATPIPRTLTLTVYGDMDVSRLSEKPAGRQPIDTRLISNERADEVMEALRRKIAEKSRIYWVCPLVAESENLDLAAAEERFLQLQQLFGTRVGLLHGRMKPTEKDETMAAFARGDYDILVSTTIIEVGMDVPEATVMVIEHAERFGLAQLHQLRGRIGRGPGKSVCILLYAPQAGEIGRKRLTTIRDTEDGFIIAEEDLKLRGAGEVLGTRQSGLPAFRLADPDAHADLIRMAFDDARLILEKDPQLTSARGTALRALLYLFERDTAIKYLRSG